MSDRQTPHKNTRTPTKLECWNRLRPARDVGVRVVCREWMWVIVERVRYPGVMFCGQED